MNYHFDRDGNLRDDRTGGPPDDEPMTAIDIETWLEDMIAGDPEIEFDVETFEQGGVLTKDRGLTITDAVGNSWQITIVRCGTPDADRKTKRRQS